MDYMLKARLACLSTDEKPTSIPGYTNDLKYSVLWELDTDKKYYYTGEEWAEVGSGGGGDSEYLLRNASKEGERQGDGGYLFTFAFSELNAAALQILEEPMDQSQAPDLLITCADFTLEDVLLEPEGTLWVDNVDTRAEVDIYRQTEVLEVWIDGNGETAPTKTAVIDVKLVTE